jgi:sterol desaturase/sphingolipid hydroxylase (fatty acid hydroxylase superfamily)
VALWDKLQAMAAGVDPLTFWLVTFAAGGILAGVFTGYFRARKIQPNGFKWRIFRHEVVFAVINVGFSSLVLGGATKYLQHHGFIRFNTAPTSVWVMAAEYVLYFVGFDTWFYWLHRAMHVEPFYKLVHKLHHRSISPNPLTTLSVNPLESLINGGWVPIFTFLMTLHPSTMTHASTMAIIGPTNVIMGFYVHSGIEFFPRWWNKSWLTKWFITATFHDQHHRYFKGNYGGYTTVWDRICGTVRPTFEADFEKVTTRPIRRGPAAPAKQRVEA